MRSTIGAGNGDCLVKTAEETLNTDSFVIAARGGMETNAKELTSSGKNAAESAASIDNNEAAHANFQQNLLK
jgi:hypothetical protein